jgi:translation initiation factor IF-2
MLKTLQKVNENRICVKRNKLCLNFSSYKTYEEKILNLLEPLKIQLVSISDRKKLLALDDDIGFKSGSEASLNSKTFKKNKRNEKDINEEESDKVKIKSKFKQKNRSKSDFQDELDPNSDLSNNISDTSEAIKLSLIRPEKSFQIKSVKQKNSSSSGSNSKNKNSKKNNKNESVNDGPNQEKPTSVTLSKAMTIEELSELYVVPETEIIRNLFLKGFSVTMNQTIDIKMATNIAKDFEIDVIVLTEEKLPIQKKVEFEESEIKTLQNRPPIVTIVGHVDHGKTTLLDKIRKTKVAQQEAGGITQTIGAYEVDVKDGNEDKKIVFLDTPGHEAFSMMRSRGISLTDIAVLVVAADDGVKPQTVESIKAMKACKVPILVAINKIDKEGADIEIIKQELAKYDLISENWGGNTPMVPISALQGTNIDQLLEMILLMSELQSLKFNPVDPAQGTVLESKIDKNRGPLATLLIQNGTLSVGDIIVCGDTLCKVKGMLSSNGVSITKAEASWPVVIWGFSKLPPVGEEFCTVENEKEGKLKIDVAKATITSEKFASSGLIESSDSEDKKKLNLIIKTDVQGSSEAIITTLSKLSDSNIDLRILYITPGDVTETDVDFASTSSAMILAFNTKILSGANKQAKQSKIVIKSYDVIYDLFDDVKILIDDLIGPQYIEEKIGEAIVKGVFPLAKSFVAGSYVTEGKVKKMCHVHIVREGEIIHKGTLSSLKRIKEDVSEMKSDTECGIFVDDFDEWKVGDVIRSFNLIEKNKNA